jgi:hypothetical protein
MKLLSRIEARDYIEQYILPQNFYYVYHLIYKGRLIYVGKGQRKRVLQHFIQGNDLPSKTMIGFYFISRDANLVGVVESQQIDEHGPVRNKRAGSSFTVKNGTYVSTNSLRSKYKKVNTGKDYDPCLHAMRISRALKGRKISADVRARMSAGQKGKILSAEHRRKISESRKFSDKVKQAAIAATVAVEIYGKRYHNLYQASLALDINYATMRYRLQKSHEGYRVVE